jgi:hypothetical protein
VRARARAISLQGRPVARAVESVRQNGARHGGQLACVTACTAQRQSVCRLDASDLTVHLWGLTVTASIRALMAVELDKEFGLLERDETR